MGESDATLALAFDPAGCFTSRKTKHIITSTLKIISCEPMATAMAHKILNIKPVQFPSCRGVGDGSQWSSSWGERSILLISCTQSDEKYINLSFA